MPAEMLEITDTTDRQMIGQWLNSLEIPEALLFFEHRATLENNLGGYIATLVRYVSHYNWSDTVDVLKAMVEDGRYKMALFNFWITEAGIPEDVYKYRLREKKKLEQKMIILESACVKTMERYLPLMGRYKLQSALYRDVDYEFQLFPSQSFSSLELKNTLHRLGGLDSSLY